MIGMTLYLCLVVCGLFFIYIGWSRTGKICSCAAIGGVFFAALSGTIKDHGAAMLVAVTGIYCIAFLACLMGVCPKFKMIDNISPGESVIDRVADEAPPTWAVSVPEATESRDAVIVINFDGHGVIAVERKKLFSELRIVTICAVRRPGDSIFGPILATKTLMWRYI